MANATIDFDAPDLAKCAERASLFELDHLPFDVIRLARDGTVQFYSATEARLSGYGEIPLRKKIFSPNQLVSAATPSAAASNAPWSKARSISKSAGPATTAIRGANCVFARSAGLWLFIERDDATLKNAS